MPQLVEATDLHQESDDQTQSADRQDLQRSKLRSCLDEIASEVGAALEDAALGMPMFYSVPSGGPLLTFMTPSDPADEAWEKVSQTICDILASKIVVGKLTARQLACAASGASVNVSEVAGGGGQTMI